MPKYKITDPKTGKVYRVTLDSPPSDDEIDEILSGPAQEQEKPMDSPGFTGRVSDDITGLKDLPGNVLTEMQGNSMGGPVGALMRILGKGAINSGSERAVPYLEKMDQEEDFLGKAGRGIQAGMSTIPLPGFGRTVDSGEKLVKGEEGATGELIYDALSAAAPKVGPALKGAVGGQAAKVGANLQTRGIRAQSAASVPRSEALGGFMKQHWPKRVGAIAGGELGEILGIPFSRELAYGGLAASEIPAAMEALQGSKTLGKMARGAGDILNPKGRSGIAGVPGEIDPKMFDVEPIQGPDNPLPVETFDPSLRRGIAPLDDSLNDRLNTAGPIAPVDPLEPVIKQSQPLPDEMGQFPRAESPIEPVQQGPMKFEEVGERPMNWNQPSPEFIDDIYKNSVESRYGKPPTSSGMRELPIELEEMLKQLGMLR